VEFWWVVAGINSWWTARIILAVNNHFLAYEMLSAMSGRLVFCIVMFGKLMPSLPFPQVSFALFDLTLPIVLVLRMFSVIIGIHDQGRRVSNYVNIDRGRYDKSGSPPFVLCIRFL